MVSTDFGPDRNLDLDILIPVRAIRQEIVSNLPTHIF